jgi:hypothetical protein
MNWSLTLVALMVEGPVTVMSTVPAPAGAVVVIEVALLIVNAAAAEPKWTAVTPPNCSPVSVTIVPAGPALGESPVTEGANESVH